MSQSKNNRELLEEIKLLIGSLKDQVADVKQDISKIKDTQFIHNMINKAKEDKEKYKIVEAKESTSWFW